MNYNFLRNLLRQNRFVNVRFLFSWFRQAFSKCIKMLSKCKSLHLIVCSILSITDGKFIIKPGSLTKQKIRWFYNFTEQCIPAFLNKRKDLTTSKRCAMSYFTHLLMNMHYHFILLHLLNQHHTTDIIWTQIVDCEKLNELYSLEI